MARERRHVSLYRQRVFSMYRRERKETRETKTATVAFFGDLCGLFHDIRLVELEEN